MNNDINASSSFVASCSSNSITTITAPCSTIVGNAGGEGNAAVSRSIHVSDTSSIITMASDSSSTNSFVSPSFDTILDQAPTRTEHENQPNKPESLEESREQLKDWDYCSFKQLLDEAYSYKNPRDKENKSEFFRQLLEKTEKEKEDKKFAFRTLTSRSSNSNSQKQGGSLQDLVEAVRNESLDCDYNYCGQRNRRQNHNSRPKKYSSVSSRQREGGSLPSNVNVSNCSLSVYEQPFMNDEPAKQYYDKSSVLINNASTTVAQRSVGGLTSKTTISTQGIKTTGNSSVAEVTVSTKACTFSPKSDISGIGCGGACEAPKSVKGIKSAISLAATIGSATSATCAALATATAVVSGNTDTVVEMNENYIDPHSDMLSQGIQFDRFDGIEMKIPRANIIGSVLSRNDFPTNNNTCYVDEAVHFTTLERGNSTVDSSYIPLDENYKACKSVLGEKSDLVKMQSFSASKSNSKQYDENGNSLNTTFTVNQTQTKAKKKKSHSDRNTKTLDVQSVEGYRGSDPIEELVKYIESSEDTKQSEKVNKLSENKKKDKKREKEKEKSKIKRSNSLEELRSCSNMDSDDVTLRTKTNAKNNKNVELKEKQTASSVSGSSGSGGVGVGNIGTNRKNERRSWGTEELTYLGEKNSIEEASEKIKEKERKKHKEKDINDKLEKVVEKRKKSDSNLVLSMESISCELAEFHVVTKKKKPKKQRQPIIDEGRNINNSSTNAHKNQIYQNRKYQSNFTNDRDAYMGSFHNNNNDKSRRKSTSSMPPSEKSDSSDLDSVHSLPIESAGGRSPLQAHHHQNQPRSYAEIARKTEAATAAAITSPTAAIHSSSSNSSSNNSSHTELEDNSTTAVTSVSIAPVLNTVTKKSRKNIKNDFPELISNEVAAPNISINTHPPNSIINTQKLISYSQSLTFTGKSDEHPLTDIVFQASPPRESIKANEKQIQKQPQVYLQKAKSVETDRFYNSIDQYPALEKTFKRNSTANACGSDVIVVPATSPPPGMISVQNNSNTNFAPTGNTAPSSNKKIKANAKANEETEEQHHFTTTKKIKKEKQSTNESISPSTPTPTTSSTSTSSNTNNKNQINHDHFSYNTNNNKNSCSYSHNNSINYNNSNNFGSSYNNKYSNRPAVIILNEDSAAGSLSSCIGKEFTFGDFNEDELGLFDDNQPSTQQTSHLYHKCASTTAYNFDDSKGNLNTTGGSSALNVTNNSDDTIMLMQNTSSPNSSLLIDQSSDSGICNNYNAVPAIKSNLKNIGTMSTANRSLSTDTLTNNSVYLSASTSPSKESLSSSASSSSSTSSNSSASSGTYVLNAPSNKAISLSTNKSSKSKTVPLIYPNQNPKKQHINIEKSKPTNISTMNKRNTLRQKDEMSSDDSRIMGTASANSIVKAFPSLETCDDIETAIIAAAKKAAAVAAEQTSTSVINKIYPTKSSNKCNLSQTESKIATNINTNEINTLSISNKSNIFNNSNNCGQKSVTSTSLPLSSSVLNQPNKEYSRIGGNTSSNISVNSGELVALKRQQQQQHQQKRKEIDVRFIQPTLLAINSLQNNETIINFIGSAWEEVANSKVTQFYDGQ